MRKITIAIIFIIFTLVGCERSNISNADINLGNSSEENATTDEAVEDKRVYITEDLYEPWINQIYLDPTEYEGATIRLEGMYGTYFSEDDNKNHNMVYRIVTGSGLIYEHTHEESDEDEEHIDNLQDDRYGFVFEYDGHMPEENDWIEVEGILEVYEVNGKDNLSINAKSVTIKDERGREIIS